MKLDTVHSVLALGVALQFGASSALAGSLAIGTAVTRGTFRVDSATVTGNATLFDGATVETNQAASQMELQSGARVLLASASRGRLYGDRMILEKGEGQLENDASFHLEALGLSIRPDTAASAARVVMRGENRVQVLAQSGSLRVLNAQGVPVANIAMGSALELEPLKTPALSRITGIPRTQEGRVVITDETTKVTLELAGQGLEKELGKRVAVSGAMEAGKLNAVPVLRVTQLASLMQKRGPTSPSNTGAKSSDSAAGDGNSRNNSKNKGKGKAIPAGVARGAAAGTILGLSATSVAIIGGVAAAATLGGLAAADKLPGQSSDPGTASR